VYVSDKFLIVGLGNPGREHRANRHNVGFMTLDLTVERHKLMGFTKKQGKALVTSGRVAEKPVVLAKPQTYMNLSGEAVGSLLRFYDIPLEQLLVCYDDLDLPVGTLRLRPDGGSAGQNGVKSIIQHLNTEKFPRLRIGIGRPPGRMDAAAYVLQDFRGDDAEIMDTTLARAVDALECFLQDGVVAAMNRFNGASDVNEK
jgi:PTH1 family peptidyl-tRNA hydrolase